MPIVKHAKAHLSDLTEQGCVSEMVLLVKHPKVTRRQSERTESLLPHVSVLLEDEWTK